MTTLASNRALRALLATIALATLASCGDDDDEGVVLPTPTGKQVVYTADADGDRGSNVGDEVWVADTGSVTMQVTRISGEPTGTQYVDMPFSIGSGTDKQLGYRVVTDEVDDCPARISLVPADGGVRLAYLDGTCVFELQASSTGDPFAIRTSLIGSPTAGASLLLGTTADLGTVYRIDDVDPFPNDVTMFAFSADDSTIAYVDDFGVWVSDPTVLLQAGSQVSVDLPVRLVVLPDGSATIYVVPGETQYRLVPSDGSAQTLLTNALGAGDSLDLTADAVRLSPDGTQLLYVATIGGEKQLWLVAVGSPLGEQRVDAVASLLAQSNFHFEFSPDSARFAWTGDAGSDSRIFAATVAAPTTTVALTPSATEEAFGAIRWTDATTVAYLSNDGDQPTPTGATTLRTVAFGAPLTTVALSPAETATSVVSSFTTCSDGELVFRQVDGTTAALWRATPMVAASQVQITPAVAGAEIYGFACTD